MQRSTADDCENEWKVGNAQMALIILCKNYMWNAIGNNRIVANGSLVEI